MAITPLGNNDLIIGRTWITEYDVLLDCKREQLIWPDNLPPAKDYKKIITQHPRNLTVTSSTVTDQHQKDADRRDQKLSQ
jgi:hypothetical protein